VKGDGHTLCRPPDCSELLPGSPYTARCEHRRACPWSCDSHVSCNCLRRTSKALNCRPASRFHSYRLGCTLCPNSARFKASIRLGKQTTGSRKLPHPRGIDHRYDQPSLEQPLHHDQFGAQRLHLFHQVSNPFSSIVHLLCLSLPQHRSI
jgi:hypothetical protein